MQPCLGQRQPARPSSRQAREARLDEFQGAAALGGNEQPDREASHREDRDAPPENLLLRAKPEEERETQPQEHHLSDHFQGRVQRQARDRVIHREPGPPGQPQPDERRADPRHGDESGNRRPDPPGTEKRPGRRAGRHREALPGKPAQRLLQQMQHGHGRNHPAVEHQGKIARRAAHTSRGRPPGAARPARSPRVPSQPNRGLGHRDDGVRGTARIAPSPSRFRASADIRHTWTRPRRSRHRDRGIRDTASTSC